MSQIFNNAQYFVCEEVTTTNTLVPMTFVEPTGTVASTAEVFLSYLAYFRNRVIEKVSALPPSSLASSILPSEWSSIELIKHLTFVEMRWLEWGFEGVTIEEPWGDQFEHRWQVASTETLETLVSEFRARGVETERIVRRHGLTDVGLPGPRWNGAAPPTLERVLFHLLQEFARHVGHLDIVCELIDGETGE